MALILLQAAEVARHVHLADEPSARCDRHGLGAERAEAEALVEGLGTAVALRHGERDDTEAAVGPRGVHRGAEEGGADAPPAMRVAHVHADDVSLVAGLGALAAL